MSARSLVAVSTAVALLGVSACLSFSTGSDRTAEHLELDPELCNSIRVPRDVNLASASANTRTDLMSAASKGAVGVRYVRSACHVEFEIVPGCVFEGQYVYVPLDQAPEHSLIRTGRQLLELLPIHAAQLGQWLGGGRAIAYDRGIVGELRIPPKKPIRREELDQVSCEGATHLVTGIELGRFWMATGSSEALSGVLTPPRIEPGKSPPAKATSADAGPPSLRWLAVEGEAADCERARSEARRQLGCESPVRVSLVSMAAFRASEEPPVDDMIRVPAGSFSRGLASGAKDQSPVATIELSEFEIDRTEVTASAYEVCVARGACKPAREAPFCTAGVLGKEQHPINCVDFRQAEAYCNFVDKRLPTEAEWERAARRTDSRIYAWGNEWPPPRAAANLADASVQAINPYWRIIDGYDDGYAETAPVSAFPQEGQALQLGGNVAEWVADIYGADYYAKSPKKDPNGPTRGSARVVRGASFGMWKKAEIQLTHRGFMVPDHPSMHVGFRCARTPAPREKQGGLPAGEDE